MKLLDLPKELICQILAYLDLHHLLHCTQVRLVIAFIDNVQVNVMFLGINPPSFTHTPLATPPI
jgi:hypothetical protein